MSILDLSSKKKEKRITICIGVILLITIITYAIISASCATYQCYESKINDGFQVKTGRELIEMQFEGNCDYEEIIKIDNNILEKGD